MTRLSDGLHVFIELFSCLAFFLDDFSQMTAIIVTKKLMDQQ